MPSERREESTMMQYHIQYPTINMEMTGRNIAQLRREAGLSIHDLQEIFGFTTPQAIYKWQRGATLPTVDNLVILALVFGVPIDRILVMDTAGAPMPIHDRTATLQSRC